MNQNEKEPQETLDFEIQFYEGIVQKNQDFVQALIALGDLYTKKGLYEKGLMIDRRLAFLKPEDPVVLYNLACSYSLLNCLDKALATMKLAVQCGYDNFKFMKEDKDLTNLFKDSRFQEFIAQKKID